MKKGDFIKGYKVLEDFTVIGGQSKISFVEKEGVVYFIKEFLSPKYPITGSPGSTKTKNKRKQKCDEFEKHHRNINSEISKKVSLGGNLVFAIDFFREGTTYYKINEKINISSITSKQLAELSLDKKILICKTVCHSLNILHSLGIVHGDIKPDNVLIKKTKTGNYTSKLIDFDNSYFSKNPPKNQENLVGDQVYYSPETAKFILKSKGVKPTDLTLKADVFALGVLFTEYLTGSIPKFKGDFNYPWESLLDGNEFTTVYPKSIPKSIKKLISNMLSVDFNDRPTLDNVFKVLKEYKRESSVKIEETELKEIIEPSKLTSKPILKGGLITDKKITSDESFLTKPTLRGSLIRKKK